MIPPNIFFYLKLTVLSYATQYVRIWRGKRQDTDANKKKIRRVLQGRSDRDERAKSSHRREDMRKLLDRRRR
jgi:hypothetical protein